MANLLLMNVTNSPGFVPVEQLFETNDDGSQQMLMRLFDAGLYSEPAVVKLTEIEPGKYLPVTAFPRELLPKYAAFQFMRLTNGDFRPVLKVYSQWVQLKHLRTQLGLDVSGNTIRRLAANGFIRICTITPQIILIDILSLERHMREVMDDEQYWTGDRRAQYDQTVLASQKQRVQGQVLDDEAENAPLPAFAEGQSGPNPKNAG